ncbi:MAG: ABC transporter ATP-binding protein, partial [Angelakisella sp.]
MIKLTNLRAGYPSGEKLHGISLHMKAGEITAIVGPNGCGKSTLLKVICGLLPTSEGDVAIAGRQLSDYTPKELARTIALLPQSRNIPSITVRRMVLHGRFPHLEYPRKYRKADYEIVDEAIVHVGIEALSGSSMETLSGGERQKVYLAMALAQATPIVLLDEPTTFLDVRHQLDVMELAAELRAAGKTVVLVLHDLNLALRSADTLVVMQAGQIVAADTPQHLVQ